MNYSKICYKKDLCLKAKLVTHWKTMTQNIVFLLWCAPPPPGGAQLKFGFGRDVSLRNLKVDPYKYQFFKKKWSLHIPIGPFLNKITRFFQKFFLKFEPILAHILEKLTNRSIHMYTRFCILKGVIYIPRGWFCYHDVGSTSP